MAFKFRPPSPWVPWGPPFLDHRGSPAREEPPEPPADRGPSDASNIFGERILYPSVWYISGIYISGIYCQLGDYMLNNHLFREAGNSIDQLCGGMITSLDLFFS